MFPIRKKNLEKMFRVFAIVISIFLIILVSYLKVTLESFQNWWIIVVVMFVIVLLLVVFFGFSRVKKLADSDSNLINRLPSPKTDEELYRLARDSLRNDVFFNDIRTFKQCRIFHVGKSNPNTIYLFDIETLYRDEKPITHIIINANYPQMRTVLTQPSYYELNRCIKSLSTTKEEDPYVSEETSTNPLLGITTTKKVSSPYQKRKEKKEEKKELE